MDGLVIVGTPVCAFCGKNSQVMISESELELLENDSRFIQDKFPDWDADLRELFISGTHADCWDGVFSDEDE